MFFDSYMDTFIYGITLWLGTGLVMLSLDTKVFALVGMKREKKVVHILGWFNISLGVLLIIVSWILYNWGW